MTWIKIRKLKKMGVVVVGNQIYVEEGATVRAGAKLFSPCYILGISQIDTGATIYPCCFLKDCKIGAGAEIYASTLVGATVGNSATVGPYAHLRKGAVVGENCKIGDFVEIKNSVVGKGSKIAHLSYVGDADIGKDVNVGCGVVFANYDGKKKQKSRVQDDCFIGCNCNIVAPVNVGQGAYIACGTTITSDVESKSLCVGRCAVYEKKGGAKGRYKNE